MKVQLRRYAAGAITAGALAAVGVVVLPTGSHDWTPVTYGLTASPDQLLPATVSAAEPARVLSTTLDADGRPVVTVKEATDKATATRLVEEAQAADNAVSVEMDATVTALGIPTGPDPYRGQQWDLAKMNVANAWQKSTGAGVTVAVIDTGVDASHPDLAANVLPGYDAIADTPATGTDGNGHGTHVAGTIAAVTGNNVGISAVAPDVRILPVKVLAANGSGVMSDTAEGIVWAADNGAQVINMSLGSTVKVAAVSNAIAYARSKGVTVVAAAGNSRSTGSPVSYPGADQGVIAVAATDSNDMYATYSNAGSYVDVAAPGSNIISTYPVALGSSYVGMNGTSMASPHVAAVAALLKGYQGTLTPDQIESALKTTAVDRGVPGFDIDYGYGRIDAAAALAAVTPDTTPPATPPATAPTQVPTSAPAPTPPTTAPPATAPPATTPPTTAPTAPPTTAPTAPPTTAPTVAPPTTAPTAAPTTAPTSAPTSAPTTVAPAPSRTTVTPTPSRTTVTPAPSRTTVTPAPSRTTTPVRVNPLITVNVTTREVVYGASTVSTFTVRAGGNVWARKAVSVCVTESGGVLQCTDTTTSATGTVAVTRVAKATFQVVVQVAETAANHAATSPVATYKVRATVSAARTAKGVMTVSLTGAIGQSVQVQQHSPAGWNTVATYPATSAKATVGGLVAGQRYRVVVPDTSTVLGATSGAVIA